MLNMYWVYQIQTNQFLADKINHLGREAARELRECVPYFVKMDLMFHGSKAYTPEAKQHFNVVAEVEARDLDEVFELMNLWDNEERIYPVSDRMHSLSVGDIIFDGTEWHMVDNSGFTTIEA